MMRQLALSLTALAFLCAAALSAEVNVKPGHQRLSLTKDDVARAAKNIKANGANWKRLKANIDSGAAPAPAYGIVYLATNDAGVGRKGVEVLMKTTAPEDIALGYDWLFGLLSEEQKKTLFDRVSEGVKNDASLKMSAPWTNYVQRSTMRLAMAGCAFASEYPQAQAWVDKAYDDWKTFHLPAALVTGEGGWPEGTLYSYIVYSSLARLADAFQTATDKDIWDETPWFADRITWWRFHTWPLPKDFYGRAFYMYDPYGDSEKWRAPMENQEIEAEFLAMRRFGETNAVKEWRWYMNQLGGPIMSLGSWPMLAYYDETAPAQEPKVLSYYTKGTGQIFIRSSWKPDATWLALQCGPRFTYHQHLDQGQINVFKMGDLTGESGVYEPSGPSEQEGHLQGYCSRAIAHNTINIYDPKEVFAGYRSGNSPRDDGGERTWRPFSNTAETAQIWKDGFAKGAYDTGRIAEFSETGRIVYCAMDLTGAYNSDEYVSEPNKPKVHEVTRQVVYFRSRWEGYIDCVMVFDRVRATDPSFEKRILWHFPNNVLVSGTETKVAEGEFTYDGDLAQTDTGGGRLFIRSVYPKGARINKVGGPGKEYWVFGKNFPVPDTPWERGYGQWRIEIMPPTQEADDCFLTVLFPADKSVTEAPSIAKLAGDKTLGAAFAITEKGADGRTAFFASGRALFATEGPMGARVFPPSTQTDVPILGEPYGQQSAIDTHAKPDGETATVLPCPSVKDCELSDTPPTATLKWKTDEPAVGYVEFGPTMEMKYLMTASEKPATEFSVTLRGLAPESKLYVRAAAKGAAGPVGFSKMMEIETGPDVTPPKITNLRLEQANPTDVTVSWSTDDLATGTIECAGSDGAKRSAVTVAAAADQRVTIEGLTPETEYTVTVTAKNAGGLEAKSEPLKFTTPKKMEGYFEADFEDVRADAFGMTRLEYWKVETDSESKNMALVLSKTEGGRNLALVKGFDYGDFTLRFKARTYEGEGNKWRDFCAVFGYVDDKNYYMASFSSSVDESTPGILRVKDGKEELIGRRLSTVTIPDRAWHNIEVTRKGTRIQVFWEGTLCFEADDATFGKGKIGFGSNNDSAGFDDIKIIPQASVAPAPPEIRTKKLSVEGMVIE